MKRILLFASCFLAGILASNLYASTRTWDGDVSNDWNTADNWDGNTLPSSSDDIIVSSSASNYLIVDETVTCNTLEVEGRLDLVSGGVINTTSNFYTEINSTFNMTGGTLNIGDSWKRASGYSAYGTITISSGAINVTNDVMFAEQLTDTSSNFTGYMSGDFIMTVGDDYISDGDEITFTGGTLVLTASYDSDVNFQAPNQQGEPEFWNLIINTVNSTDIIRADTLYNQYPTIYNDFTLTNGIFDADCSGDFEVEGTLTINGGEFSLTAYDDIVATDLVLNTGTFSPTVESDVFIYNDIVVNGGSFSGLVKEDIFIDRNFELNNGTVNTTVEETFDIDYDFILSNGTFSCDMGDMNIDGNLRVSGGVFTPDTDTDFVVDYDVNLSGGTLNFSNVGDDIYIDDDVIVSDGTITFPTLTTSNYVYIKDDITFSGGTVNINATEFVLNGSSGTQRITSNGVDFYNVDFYGGATFELQDDMTVENKVYFTDGDVTAVSSSVMLILEDDISISSSYPADDDSHVVCKVKKVGNDPFEFPVGNGTYYRPLSISAPSNITDEFSAQYTSSSAHDAGYDTTSLASGISYFSDCEYWTVSRDNGTSDVSTTLSINSNTCGLTGLGTTDLSEVIVTRWDGTTWQSHGNGGTTGSASDGTVLSSSALTAYGVVTLASNIVDNSVSTACTGNEGGLFDMAAYTGANYDASPGTAHGNANALIFGNYTNTDINSAGDVEGRMFVAGNFEAPNTYTVGTAAVGSVGSSNSPDNWDNLVVQGNITNQGGVGQAIRGNVVYGGSLGSSTFTFHGDGAVRQESNFSTNVFDFASAKSHLTTLSECISTAAQAGTLGTIGQVQIQSWGDINLTGTDPNVNVFNLSGMHDGSSNTIPDYYSFIISVPAGSEVIINVLDDNLYKNGGSILYNGSILHYPATNMEKILWNFSQTTDITLQSFSFYGSVLAPRADVNFTGGAINGQAAIGGNVTTGGGFEFHNFCYEGTVWSTVNCSGGNNGGNNIDISVDDAGWHYVGFACDSVLLSEVDGLIPVTGYVRIYDENAVDAAAISHDVDVWTIPSNLATTYIRRGDAVAVYTTEPTTISYSCTEEEEDVDIEIVNTCYDDVSCTVDINEICPVQGWNLIGNPYDTVVDWSNVTINGSDVSNGIYFWDPVNNRYATYVNGVGTNGGTQYIAPGQGFFIYSTTSSSSDLTFTPSAYSSQSANFYRTAQSPTVTITLDNSTNSVVRVSDEATADFDVNLDAYEINRPSETPLVASRVGNVLYAVNSIPDFVENTTVDLAISLMTSGTHTLSVEADNFEVFLEDKVLGLVYPVSESPYQFDADSSFSTSRFELRLVKSDDVTSISGALTESDVAVSPNPAQDVINIYSNENIESLELYDINGRLVSSTILNDKSHQLNTSSLVSGVYHLQIKSGNSTVTKRVLKL